MLLLDQLGNIFNHHGVWRLNFYVRIPAKFPLIVITTEITDSPSATS